jgi:deoxycytidine triphosphate deaminase
MILSNLSIHEALDKGWLKINPEPSPRKLGDAPGKCPYQTSAVDLRLGNEIAYFKEGVVRHDVGKCLARFRTPRALVNQVSRSSAQI